MNKKLLAYLVLLCALGLGATAAYYSIIGLSKLFIGVSTAVLIMAGFLEASKLTLAAFLHSFWEKLNKILKVYLTIAVISLSIITSAGIYGVLSSGYQEVNHKLELIDSEVGLIEIRKSNLESQLDTYNQERQSQNQSISSLRDGLSSNIIQYRDAESGQIITTTSAANRKSLENQLEQALGRQSQLNNRVDSLNIEILNLETQILEVQNNHDLAGEIGPLKYISEILDKPMNEVVNWLILIIVFVFDPLAISLIIAASFSFQQLRKPKTYKIYEEEKEDNVEVKEPIIEEDNTKEENTIEEVKEEKPKSKNSKISNPFEWSAWRRNKMEKEEENDLVKTY